MPETKKTHHSPKRWISLTVILVVLNLVAFNLISGSTFNNSITNGSAVGSWDLDLTGDTESDLLGGRFYVNIHTSGNPGGEIRGYIVVPEPSHAMLALVGLGSLCLVRRRA